MKNERGRRRIAVAVTCAVAIGASAGTAQAAGPTAIGVDSEGVVYVGFGEGGAIKRYAGADGASLPAWGTAGSGAGQLGGVVALDVAPGSSGNVWILDTNRRVQEFTRSGTYVRGIQLSACQSGVAPDPLQRGGIDVTETSVFVAHPCRDEVYNFRRSDLGLNNQGSVAGPKGVSAQLYDSAPEPTRRTFVAQPGQSRVAKLQPWFSTDGAVTIDGAPTDAFVDAFGVLFASERTNDRVRLLDQNGSEFRWIGGTGTEAGRFRDPTAIDVFEQYSDLSGNVFVADHDNERIQRLNPYGYTFWAVPASAGGGGTPAPAAPANTAAPAIGGNATVGQQVTCSTGTWSGSPTSYAYAWHSNGTPVGSGATHQIAPGEAGLPLTCTVTATNGGGSTQATSAPVVPAAAPSAPASTAPPSIAGSAVVGGTLTASPGSWAGNPSGFAYQWSRNGAPIAGATGSSYVVQAADAGQAITVTVTATNGAGSTAATSAAVVPTAAPTSGRVGVTINDRATYTSSPGVTLTIHEPAGATAVLIDNDGGFRDAVQVAVRGDDTYTWTLDSTGSERLPKTVYVRFVGPGVDEDRTFTDDIVLDETAATVRSATLTANRTLRVAATDRGGSGVSQVQLTSSPAAPAAKKRARKPAKVVTRAYRKRITLSRATGRTVRYVRVVDRAGNVSRWRKLRRR